jgi:SAM-dependent methyltransferase
MADPGHLDAVRVAYDAIAADYAEHFRSELEAKPLGRSMLAAFAELVRAAGGGPVADVGCGPGRVTAHLRALGLDAYGVDLSPGMVTVARRDHPGVRFEVGSLTALDVPDGALTGVVAWYSIIHLPPDDVPAALAELHRVLASGGRLLLAFQIADEPLHLTEVLGRNVSLTIRRWSPDRIVELLDAAGFAVEARLVRAPDATERTPQAHVLARRPPDPDATRGRGGPPER